MQDQDSSRLIQMERYLFPASRKGMVATATVLRQQIHCASARGDAGSWDFPPLAPIIASSIWDVSGCDRRCLIMTSSKLHGRQIGSPCWICTLSGFCRPGTLSSFHFARLILPLILTLALFVVFSPSFYCLQVLLRWICQILSGSQPGLTSSPALPLL